MFSVNDLIQNAYTRTGLVGDGQSVNGIRAKTALLELNDLIRTLNLQEYLADNIKIVEVNAASKITISKSIYSDIVVDEIPSHIKSVARKVGNRFIPLHTSNLEVIGMDSGASLARQFTYNVNFDKSLEVPTIREDVLLVTSQDQLPAYGIRNPNPPHNVAYMCKDGVFDLLNENGGVWWWAAVTGDQEGTIYGWKSSSQARDLDVKVRNLCEVEKGGMCGVITIDSHRNETYKVMFTEEIPEYELDDKIVLQSMYKGLLLAGLSYKLAIRYKVQDWVGTFKDEFDKQKSLIKRTNSTNRNLTWMDSENLSYDDAYFNGLCGKGW